MNSKIKHFTKLIALLFFLILVGCQKEDLNQSITEPEGNVIKSYTFKQATQLLKFNNAYNKYSDRREKYKKTNREADSDFKIDSSTVKEVVLNGITTYSMTIRRPNSNNLYFENLVIQVNPQDSTRAYIAKYTPDNFMNYNNSYNFSGKAEIKEIVYNPSIFAKDGRVCITYMVCYFAGHDVNNEDKCTHAVPETTCYGETATGGGSGGASGTGSGTGTGTSSGGTSGTSSGTGSNGGSESPTVVTAPVVPPPPMQKKENCEIKKKLENDATFKNAMSNLLSYARNSSFETYNVMNNATNPIPTNNFTYNIQNGTIAVPELAYVGNINMQGVIHSHFGDLFSIFSGVDLYDLYLKLKNNPQITDNIFLGLVTSKNTAYLLQIDDRNAFIAFGDAYMATERELARFMIDKMADKYGMHGNGNPATNELGFYKMMSDLNIGVNLSSATILSTATPSSDMFNSWTTKFYDKKSGQIKILNCL